MSCFINSSLTEEELKLAQGERAGSGRAGIQTLASSYKLVPCAPRRLQHLARQSPWSHIIRKFYAASFISELGDCEVWELILSGLASQKALRWGLGGARSVRELPDSSPTEICPMKLLCLRRKSPESTPFIINWNISLFFFFFKSLSRYLCKSRCCLKEERKKF